MSFIIEKLDRKYGTWMFYTALVLFLVSYSWYWCSKTPSLILAITKYSTIIAQIICCIRLGLLSWKYPKYVLLCALIIALLYLSSHLSHSTMLLNTAMFIAASRDEDINRIVSVFLVVYLIVLIVVPATYVLGWTGDIVKHKCGLVGHSWGFINPNRFAFIAQMLIFMVFLYFRIRKTWIVWLISYSFAAVIGLITLSMGHAIMVADVAVHPVTGKKIFLLLQGSTPACSMHILNNNDNTAISPWFELDENASMLDFGTASYRSDELRFFDN